MDTNVTIETAVLHDLHCGCFACGGDNPSGLKLHFEVDEGGFASAIWQPSPAFRSYADRVHGGILAALLDSAMVHALFAKGVIGVTAELNIRYLRGVIGDLPVEVRGWVESDRHGLFLCAAQVHQAGILVVKASAKFMPMAEA